MADQTLSYYDLGKTQTLCITEYQDHLSIILIPYRDLRCGSGHFLYLMTIRRLGILPPNYDMRILSTKLVAREY